MTSSSFPFRIDARDSATRARAGILGTAHGEIETPIFMPVGTQGTVKGVHQDTLRDIVGAQIILGNTYHLYLRPGMEVVRGAGGLHKFMSWDSPILTDSGGYQVYSLSKMRKIREEGVSFQSHIDGSRHTLSPERAVDIQREIGADCIMAFDECTPYPCDRKYAGASMELTHRWLDRCLNHFDNQVPLYGFAQTLVPIVQGSTYTDLRKISAEYVASKETAINAIGGLSVGEPAEEMYAMTEAVCTVLPGDKPRYLMGVGTPANILECIALGIDMFDCVMPTRNARHGLLYTWDGIINIRNERWKSDHGPIDGKGSVWSATYSKAYLRHLIMSNELMGSMLASAHNLRFYLDLVRAARREICAGTFSDWKQRILPQLSVRIT